MVDSGIKCHPSCFEAFAALGKRKLEYIIMTIEKVDGKKQIVIKEQSEDGSSETELKDSDQNLKGASPSWYCFSNRIKTYPIAFGACYVDFTSKEGRQITKLPFLYWCTHDATVGDRMVYSATKIKRHLPTTNCTIQSGDTDDIEFNEVVKKVSKVGCR